MKLKTLIFLFIGISFNFFSAVANQHTQDRKVWNPSLWVNDFIQEAKLEDLEDQAGGRYPESFKWILEKTIGWIPEKSLGQESRCSQRFGAFYEKLLKSELPSNKKRYLEDFLKTCSPVESNNNPWTVLKNISQIHDFPQEKGYRRVTLHFPGGIKTQALLGLKDNKKRDWIVIRPGIFASTNEIIAEKYLLILLYELSPFNVIYLESSTSSDHLFHNKKVFLGGAKEAFENIYLIKELRSHPFFSKLINKIHLFGMSLGGNGVLLASLINAENHYSFFEKTLLFCPLIDLKTTYQQSLSPSLWNLIKDLWSAQRFTYILSQRQAFPMGFWQGIFNLTPRNITGYYELVKRDYTIEPTLYKGFGEKYYSGDFEKDVDFFKKIKVLPDHFYLWATKTDVLVPTTLNYDFLKPLESEKQFFFLFDKGNHCSFLYAYNLEFLKSLILGILE
ncbi:MAG: hypothetical protein L6Q37_02795 [Bdellovibrionaceae bacterium]|nr:hypothetical protein [Pseudobdellovibrionaceae bacterium]NUM57743.1 hypothetical protein [Pseudobdellovibrionaceae bacterium]